MISFIFSSAVIVTRVWAAPQISSRPELAAWDGRDDGELLDDVRAMMDHAAAVVATRFGLAPDDAAHAVELAFDTTGLVARAFDASLVAPRRPVCFDEDLRRAILKAAGEFHPGWHRMIDEAEAPVNPRAEVLRRLSLHEGGAERGLRLAFGDDRWRAEALSGPAWTERPYPRLRDFAFVHLVKLRALARARLSLAGLAPSAPRARVLAAMDGVAVDLRRQTLELPTRITEATELARERRRARRGQQQQHVHHSAWRRLGPIEPRLALADWHRLLAEVAASHGFEPELLGPVPSAGRRCNGLITRANADVGPR